MGIYGEDYIELVEAFSKIRTRSILGQLPIKRIREVMRNSAALEHYAAGTKLRRSSEIVDLYVVVEGQVVVEEVSNLGRVEVETVTSGRSLELDMVVSEQQSYRYEWVAEGPVEAIRIDVKEFLKVLAESADFSKYLKRITGCPELRKVKNELRLFGFSNPEIIASINAFDLVTLTTEAMEPSKDGAVVVIREGELTVTGEAPITGLVLNLGQFSESDYVAIFPANNTLHLKHMPMRGGRFSYWHLAIETWKVVVKDVTVDRFCKIADSITSRLEENRRAIERDIHEKAAGPRYEEAKDPGIDVDAFMKENVPSELKRRRKPVAVLQRDQMDCGAAVLATLSKYYGRNIGIADFRRMVSVTREGASLASLEKAARYVGFEALAISCGIQFLDSMVLPAVALLQHHYVVLYKITDKYVVVGDPATGIATRPREDFEKEFAEFILVVKPTPALKEFPETRAGYAKYLLIFEGQERNFTAIMVLVLTSFIFGIALPFLNQIVFDDLFISERADLLIGVIVVGAALGLTNLAIQTTRNVLVNHFTTVIDARFGALLLAQIFRLPVSFFAVRHTGDIMMRFSEIQNIRGFLSAKPVTILMDVLSVIIYGSVLFLYSAYLFGIVAGFLPVILAVVIYVTPIFKRYSERAFRQGSKNASVFFEQLRAIESIKAMSSTIAARWRWEVSVTESIRLSLKTMRANSILTVVNALINNAMSTSIMACSFWLYLEGHLTLGQVTAVSTLSGMVIGPAVRLVSEWQSFQQITLSFGRVDDIITAPTESTLPNPKLVDANVVGNISFQAVSFRYGSELSPLNLDSISLDIKAGSTVAFVGASGSGKTTAALMINSLYQPTSGQILIDGHPTTSYPLQSLRRQVVLILQENGLLQGTILENICLGDPNPSFGRAVEAARAAAAHDFISSLPKGYATQIGDGGTGLSGGQRQRICISRALYVNPPVLIMDEATSALDAVTEAKVMESVNSRVNRTTILIAHRLNTVAHADFIYVFDKGRIIESGSHTELLRRQGKYYNFFRRQLVA